MSPSEMMFGQLLKTIRISSQNIGKAIIQQKLEEKQDSSMEFFDQNAKDLEPRTVRRIKPNFLNENVKRKS